MKKLNVKVSHMYLYITKAMNLYNFYLYITKAMNLYNYYRETRRFKKIILELRMHNKLIYIFFLKMFEISVGWP